MAKKWYTAKVTETHALTGISLVKGEKYAIEESLAGTEIFEPVTDPGPVTESVSTGKEIN